MVVPLRMVMLVPRLESPSPKASMEITMQRNTRISCGTWSSSSRLRVLEMKKVFITSMHLMGDAKLWWRSRGGDSKVERP